VPVALAALEAGKHVLIEKPFAPSLADAQRVVDAAAERGLIAMISQNYRFYPAPQAVKHLIAEHALGPVDSVRIAFRKYANTRPRGTPGHYALPDPLLMDMAIHHFDLLRMVLGQEPQTISCHAWNPPWSNFVEPAAAAATITFDGGAVAQYSGSWASTSTPTLWAGEWTIECADGEIVWTSRNDRGADEDRVVVRRRGEAARRMALPALPCIDRSGALTAFAHAIQTGQTPESSARDNLGSLALSLGAIEAARTGQPQAIGALMSSSAALDPA
jgi:predicted dehydrogenase